MPRPQPRPAAAPAHLIIRAEFGGPGSPRLREWLRRALAPRGRRPLPLTVRVDDLQGRNLVMLADADAWTDLPLPAGTYQVGVGLGSVQRVYTMTLQAGLPARLTIQFAGSRY